MKSDGLGEIEIFYFFQSYSSYLSVYILRPSESEKTVLVLSKSESVKFLLIESVICLFTDSSVKIKYCTIKSVDYH